MSSPSSKQHIDLIRHRELNALRRLMAQQAQTLPENPVYLPTQPQTLDAPLDQKMAQINALEAQMTATPTGVQDSTATVFAMTAPPTLMPVPTAEQTVIHEAAALFADNNSVLAQRKLEQAILPMGTRSAHVPTWLALLDLYRATGQSEAFDATALDFSVRFGRSTPSWVCLPELAAQSQTKPSQNAALSVRWVAPMRLSATDIEALSKIMTSQAKLGQVLLMDWTNLAEIDDACWLDLCQLLQTLAQTPLECHIQSAQSLSGQLGKATANQALAQLAWLRCQGLEGSFEEAAIDYCSTFEVSPPDWTRPLCTLRMVEDTNASSKGFQSNATSALVLVGEVTTGLPPAFQAYLTQPERASTGVLVPCDCLVRIDSAATVELRLWCSALQAQGQTVTLKGVHKLISAHFLAQGLFAVAKITSRSD